MSDFTKGQWIVENANVTLAFNKYRKVRCAIISEDKTEIARTSGLYPATNGKLPSGDEANARLISTAPLGYKLAEEALAMEQDGDVVLHAAKIHNLACQIKSRADRKDRAMNGMVFELKTSPPSPNSVAGECANCHTKVWESLSILDSCYNVYLGRCPKCNALNYLSTNTGLRGYSSSGMDLVLPTPEEAKANELPDGVPLAPSAGHPADMHGSPLGELLYRLRKDRL